MAYTPTVWTSGDIVTSTKLNKLENGVANASAKELPAVSGTDNGKILTVVEGVWAKADSPSELPVVTGADNGNVLTVVEGSWAKANSPILLVEISEGVNEGSLVTNKTAGEIMNAHFAIFYMSNGDSKSFYPYNYGYDGELYRVTLILSGEEISLNAEDENELLLYDPNSPAPPLE